MTGSEAPCTSPAVLTTPQGAGPVPGRCPVELGLPPAEACRKALAFERLISDLSSRFIHLAPEAVGIGISDALREVCTALSLDLAVLWQWSADNPDAIYPTHHFGTLHGLDSLEPMRADQFPWYLEEMRAGRVVVLPSLADLPEAAAVDRETCRALGVKSNLTVPLALEGESPLGALGFNTLDAERDWPVELISRLALVAQVLTSALGRSRRDRALRTVAARLTAAADLADLGFYEVDLAQGRIFMDERFLRICGVPPEAQEGLQGLSFWMDHLHPDDRPRILEDRQRLHGGEVPELSVEYRFLHPLQGVRWMHHIARVAQRDARGQTVKSFGVLRDITDRREAEEALRRSLDEVEQLKDRLQAESDYLKAEMTLQGVPGEVLGTSAPILKALREAAQVAPTDAAVLVCGETGTGKELIAQAIHRLSRRSSQLLVKVNCAALPSGLVESELFGREKGAFTGALTRQAGRFEVADGSTLFLDEIGEVPLEVQAKLLRVLETGEFERLGSSRTLKVDVRIIAATNRDLLEEVRKGRFRQDLYYRLHVFPVHVPPLRARVEDIPLLVWAFLEEFTTRMGKKITQVPRTTMEALQRHPWPGNVRELRNVIERAAIITSGDVLRVPALDAGTLEAPAPRTLADADRDHIRAVLERTGWRIKGPRGAAAELGLNPATLYSRLKKLGLWPRSDAPA